MWSNVISPSSPTTANEFTTTTTTTGDLQTDPPPTRYKHSTALHTPTTPSSSDNNDVFIYVYGGRSGTFALKDFWELNLKTGSWREIKPPSAAAATTTTSDTSWPPRLQEHTLVSANNRLYMFGGECHHNSDTNSHVWVWCKEHEAIGWEKIRFKQSNPNNFPTKNNKSNNFITNSIATNTVAVPVMRRGHSAVVCEVEGIGLTIVIFGGYRDLKGSLGDCWGYGVNTNTWTLLSSHGNSTGGGVSSSSSSSSGSNSNSGGHSFWTNILSYWTGGNNSSSMTTTNSSTSYTNLIQSNSNNGYYKSGGGNSSSSSNGGGVVEGPHPQPRHNHSAVYHNNRMYVYGGMCDLVELNDFWALDLETRRWSQIKCLFSPGVLKGHGSCVVGSFMYLFGGEGKDGLRLDSVWKFDFVGETFERLQFPGCHPCPRVFATATKLPRRKAAKQQQQQQQQQCSNNVVMKPPGSLQLIQISKESQNVGGGVNSSTTVKKSTSTVRFADTQTIRYSQNGCSSSMTTPVVGVGVVQTPDCSDYSSMETINYVENPNYNGKGGGGGESIEMRLINNGVVEGNCGGFLPFNNGKRKVVQQQQQHAEYVLVVGGLESHKSAVFSKKDLVVWRLRVDCFCNEEEDDDDDEDGRISRRRRDNDYYYDDDGGGEERYRRGNNGGSFSRERSFEVEF